MSIPMYEPLYAAPPITEQHVRTAWLLTWSVTPIGTCAEGPGLIEACL